ncbi:acyltransferase family protein, partial [Amycolatopsis arida]
ADRLLSTRPLEYLGNLSYALYLWHWPVLLFYLVARDEERVGLRGGAVVIGVSLGLSVLTYHLVETPVRRWSPAGGRSWPAYRLGVLMLAPVLLTAAAWQVVAIEKASAYALTTDDPDHPGALAREPGFEYWGADDVPLVPSFVGVPQDWAIIPNQDCTISPRNPDLRMCRNWVEGVPDRRIVVVGDSHVEQYLAALVPIAEDRNWEVTAMLRGACPFSTDSEARPGDQRCVDWNADVVQEIVGTRPDAVVTLASREVRVGLTEQTPPGFVTQWRTLERAGIPVLAVRDNPRYDFKPSACVEQHGVDDPRCATPRAELYSAEPPWSGIPDPPANVTFLDFTDYLCTETVCPPAIGNVLVYLDDNHLSATYVRTMTPIVEREVLAALGW